MTMEVQDLGRVEYEDAHRLQSELVQARRTDEVPDRLLLLEHPPVITLGRGTDRENLLQVEGFPVVAIERGGDVTLHVPGQLVGYAIMRLEPGARDLHAHLRRIEGFLIDVLARHGVAGRREPGSTGVWVADRKIASIGIACRHWVTFHGFALNVSNDLAPFQTINPCGFPASVMTSLAREGATAADVPSVIRTMKDLAGMLSPPSPKKGVAEDS